MSGKILPNNLGLFLIQIYTQLPQIMRLMSQRIVIKISILIKPTHASRARNKILIDTYQVFELNYKGGALFTSTTLAVGVSDKIFVFLPLTRPPSWFSYARKRQRQVHTLLLLKSKNNRENGRLSLFMAAVLSRQYYGGQFWRERKCLLLLILGAVWQIFRFFKRVGSLAVLAPLLCSWSFKKF